MSKIILYGRDVFGVNVNAHTGCDHYCSALDVIAIKFKCCDRYYSCYHCHLEMETHPIEQWHSDEFNIKAVLCGRCGIELTINQYIFSNHQCINCATSFNPGCKKHWDLYFSFKS